MSAVMATVGRWLGGPGTDVSPSGPEARQWLGHDECIRLEVVSFEWWHDVGCAQAEADAADQDADYRLEDARA